MITKNTFISDLLVNVKDSIIILKNAGLAIDGCNFETGRSLESLFTENEFSEDKVEKVLDHLNKLPVNKRDFAVPEKTDFLLEEIVEGNKKYYKIAGVMLTESALTNLKQFATGRGLRVKLETGGCSGFKYSYNYADEAGEGEKEYPLDDSFVIFMDDFTFGRTKGSIFEFKLGLHDSGLQIINPNQKKSCSCGNSIAF